MRQWARKSKYALILFKIWQNRALRKKFVSGSIETSHGSSLARKNLIESLDYIDGQFNDYRKYGELTDEELHGKRILEVGYGDNVGVALRLIAAGAAQVVCVDKFDAKHDLNKEREVYLNLRERLGSKEQLRFDESVDLSRGVMLNEKRITCVKGIDLSEDGDDFLKDHGHFDIILSRAVIEEIYEPEQLFATFDQLLEPNGLMLHKIDLSDYGIFSEGGMHPLTFLTIPRSVYRLMASDSGIPNRKLTSYYRQQMAKLNYTVRFLVTSVVGHGFVEPHQAIDDLDNDYRRAGKPVVDAIRSRLCPEFKNLSDDELMISGLFLVARKSTG
jgi:SAM-dependent methyltransferase